MRGKKAAGGFEPPTHGFSVLDSLCYHVTADPLSDPLLYHNRWFVTEDRQSIKALLTLD
ncbi:MAG: hypothetical protein ACYS1A_01990 [Planctomycetota bacterium]